MPPSTRPLAALVCALVALSGPVAAHASDLPRRDMNDQVLRNAKGWLIFKGDVEPGWENRNVQVYKRLCKGCEWKLVKKVETDDRGHWKTRIYAPRDRLLVLEGARPPRRGVREVGHPDLADVRRVVRHQHERPPPGWGLFVLLSARVERRG